MAVQTINPFPAPGCGSLDPERTLGKRTARFSKPRTIPRSLRKGGSDRAHGQCHLTWKDCPGCPFAAPGAARGLAPPRHAEREDASEPPLGPDPERLVFCSLHDVKLPDVAIRRVSQSCRDLAIGQEGSRHVSLPIGSFVASRMLVEPTGIEPVTSCLQSTRSPS
jgi:hypothetical protein